MKIAIETTKTLSESDLENIIDVWNQKSLNKYYYYKFNNKRM